MRSTIIDVHRLTNLHRRGDAMEARCPACAEIGRDRTGNHLWIAESGKYGCAAYPADTAHRRRIYALVGVAETSPRPSTPPRALPALRELTFREVDRIAESRGFPLNVGIELARHRGLVHACNLRDGPGDPVSCWAITDSARKVIQARRMDGRPFGHRWDSGSKTWTACTPYKAKTIGLAGWPVGAADIGDRPCVLLAEGNTDFLAAHLFVWWWRAVDAVAVVGMLGAGQSIDADAARYFHGKRCRILIDADAAGESAAARWASQLFKAGAVAVSGCRWTGCAMRDGTACKDACDFATTLDPELEAPVNPLEGLAKMEDQT